MRPMKPDPGIRVQAVRIPTENGGMSALLLSPLAAPKNAAGILWLHGGGYIAGMKEMVHASRAVDLVKKFGAVVLSPGYRLALKAPYPAAIDDCYAALLYLKAHAAAFGVRSDQLMVGGESAGGGLCAAVYLFAKTPAFALSWWLSGLSYDALHGAGNFAIMLLLYRPLRKALRAAKRQIGY